jgi:cytochrome P450
VAIATGQPTFSEESIGARFDPVGNRAELKALLARARTDEPVFYSPKFDCWVVTRYEDVRSVLDNHQGFSSEGAMDAGAVLAAEAEAILRTGVEYPTPRVLANCDPPDHTRVRAAVSKKLTPRRVSEMEPSIRAYADELLGDVLDAGCMDYVSDFAYQFPLTVALEFLGLPLEDTEQIKGWSDAWLMLLWGTEASADQQVAWATDVVAYQRYIEAFIADRRSRPHDDFMSDLIASVYDGERQMTHAELVHLIALNIIPAAHESTSSLLSACAYNLLAHRESWEEICRDPGLIPNAVEEVLRIDGPGVGFFRYVPEDVVLSGVRIPAGSRAFYCHYSGNLDASVFPDPERFDPRRANAGENLGFGHGVHFCLGASLARREARVALEVLSARIPNLRLVPDQPLEYMPSLIIRGLEHLLVEWD